MISPTIPMLKITVATSLVDKQDINNKGELITYELSHVQHKPSFIHREITVHAASLLKSP